MNRNLQLNIKSYIKGLMLLGIIFTFAACQDKDEFTPDPITGDVEDFYEDAQGAFATETFDVTTDYVYITNNNTSIHIPANSLTNSDGSVATGMATITFEDVLNKGELVIHNLPTMSDGELLSSEGAFFFSFTQDENELSIAPGTLLTVRITDPQAEAGVQLYGGFDYDINEDWSLSSQTMSLETWSFFWDGKDWDGSGYELYVSETGWYNVSKLIDPAMSASEQICIQLPVELFDGNNSDVFLILDDYDTVIPLEMDSGKMLFCASFSNMPEGTEATIVSISSLGETNYYYGTSHAIISVDTEQITIVPESKTKEQILDLLGMF